MLKLLPTCLAALLLPGLCPTAVRAADRPVYAHTLQVGPFRQDISHRYTRADGLPAADVQEILVSDGVRCAITAHGNARFDGQTWHDTPASLDIVLAHRPGLDVDILNKVFKKPPGVTLHAVVSDAGGMWVATDHGLFRLTGNNLELEAVPDHSSWGRLLSPNIQCLAEDKSGTLWIGTDRGVNLYRAGEWQEITGKEGLPVLDVRTITPGPDGSVWFGTPQGAARLLDGKWRYYAGKRWLPDDRVNEIAVDQNGDAWIATQGGVVWIEYRKMTLARKAAHYEEITAARHNRRGYVTECALRTPGDVSSFVHEAEDNDGLWTSLYVASQCFRYGVTRDPAARASAKKSMDALLFLVDVTGIPGFMARAVKEKDENCVGYSPDEPNWQHVNPKYPNIFWKDDTSSDEVDGHYLAWYLYSTLVADAGEKHRIAEVCRAVTNHIIDHGYYLVGPSGKPTTWGVWAPEKLNSNDRDWSDEHGLNSLEILSHLKVAIALCGDQKFKAAYRDLIEKQHYVLNTVGQKLLPPFGADNHSDDELAWCAYYPLLMLEKDPDLLRLYRLSLERTQRILQPQGSPFYDFLYGAATGHPCDAETGAEWLRNAPWELIEWTTINSHRADVQIAVVRGREREVQLTRVLPNSEREVTKWNSNPYQADGGAEGREELDGSFWLLPYWLGRYHGIISE
jgi:hypothetical protein